MVEKQQQIHNCRYVLCESQSICIFFALFRSSVNGPTMHWPRWPKPPIFFFMLNCGLSGSRANPVWFTVQASNVQFTHYLLFFPGTIYVSIYIDTYIIPACLMLVYIDWRVIQLEIKLWKHIIKIGILFWILNFYPTAWWWFIHLYHVFYLRKICGPKGVSHEVTDLRLRVLLLDFWSTRSESVNLMSSRFN